jgi:hypothetical protein
MFGEEQVVARHVVGTERIAVGTGGAEVVAVGCSWHGWSEATKK